MSAPSPPGLPPAQHEYGIEDAIAPVNVRNGLAFASGWLGILSFVCVGPILGIPAIITGVLALKKPELGGQGRAWTGIITGSITSVLYTIFMLLSLLG